MMRGNESPSRTRCPTQGELAGFSAGRIAPVAADAIAVHIESCDRCQAVLDGITNDDDPIVMHLRDSYCNLPIAEEEADRVAMQTASLRDDCGAATSEPSDLAQESSSGPTESGPTENVLKIRCPYCHELSSADDASPKETVVCAKCGGKFALALEEAEGAVVHAGSRVAHYEILEFLGEGSFGTVWKARDTILQRLVALKVPRRGRLHGRNVELFLREARLAAQVRHPGIVQVYEVGIEKSTVYLASELIEEPSLDVSLTQHRYSVVEAATLCRFIAEAMQAAHAAGMVHRDLKPANILLDQAGKPHVTDFGLARHSVTDVAVTAEGKILGTPIYMSPEQATGNVADVDHRSDIYSIGVILYELLTGRPPFDGDFHVLVSKILLDEPASPRVLNPSVPRDLETICRKCLEKKPSHRYRSAEDLAVDLRLFLEGKAVHARPVTRVGRTWRWMRRKPVLASLSAVAGLLLVSTVAALGFGHWTATSAYRSAQTNLYFHSITAAQQRWLANDPRAAETILDQCPSKLRDFEWGYLKHLVRTPVRRLPEAGGVIAYSADGHSLVTGGGPKYGLKVWDLQTDSRAMQMKGHRDYLSTIEFHPTESLVASAGREDRTIRVWDPSKGRAVRVLDAFDRSIERCAFSPDGSKIISHERGNLFRVWSTTTGEELQSMQLNLKGVRDVAFSPIATHLAVASGRRAKSQVSIYNYETRALVTRIPTFHSATGSLAYSGDGNRLAVGEARRAMRIWQLAPTVIRLATIPGPVSERCRVTFDATGERVAAEALDGTIRVWEIKRGETLFTLRGHSRPVYAIAFSPDGTRLAAGTGNEVCIWDVTTEQGSIAYRDGRSAVRDVAVSPNNEYLAAGFNDGSAKIWEKATGKLVNAFSENGATVSSVAFAPDNERIAIAGEDRSVKIYSIRSGELELEFTEHTRPLRCVVFSPDGTLAASAGMGKTIHVWDAQTGRVRHTFRMKRGAAVRALAFHPDGRSLVSGGAGPDVCLFDVAKGDVVWTKHWNVVFRVWDLAFSPNGQLLAVGRGDGSVRIRRSEDGTLVKRFGDPAETLPIALAFSPSGGRLATATARTAVSLWEPSSGRNVLTISRHASTSAAIAFSPDGQTVITGDVHGTVRLWPTVDYSADVSRRP